MAAGEVTGGGAENGNQCMSDAERLGTVEKERFDPVVRGQVRDHVEGSLEQIRFQHVASHDDLQRQAGRFLGETLADFFLRNGKGDSRLAGQWPPCFVPKAPSPAATPGLQS